jgi:dTDP-4-amino-4,6-dideoxygalactose transaminase
LIPWPEVPAYPIVSDLRLLAPQTAASTAGTRAGLPALGRPLFTPSGRSALGWAFKASDLGPGDAVLLPAYHCLAMVEPLEWLGLRPVFYKLNDDLGIDFDDLEGRLDKSCKALISVHYFGFPQQGQRLRAFCDHFGLTLIEDCAHSFYGSDNGVALGSFGDYAIGSLPKFFPLRAGGCLVSARDAIPRAALARQSPLANLRAFVLDLQTAHYYGRLAALLPVTTGAAAAGKLFTLLGFGSDITRLGGTGTSLEYSASWIAMRTLLSCSPETIAVRRRANYERICRLLAERPGIQVLKPGLAPGVVPYMVPLRIPALPRIFSRLEDRAVPMQRFGQFLAPELNPALCQVSSDLSHHGLQLPCHQSLKDNEIEWMVEQLTEICHDAPPGRDSGPKGAS